MTVQRIVEFADGTKVVFGAEREGGLAEVGAAEEVVIRRWRGRPVPDAP
jgi:hypothetical protein